MFQVLFSIRLYLWEYTRKPEKNLHFIPTILLPKFEFCQLLRFRKKFHKCNVFNFCITSYPLHKVTEENRIFYNANAWECVADKRKTSYEIEKNISHDNAGKNLPYINISNRSDINLFSITSTRILHIDGKTLYHYFFHCECVNVKIS